MVKASTRCKRILDGTYFTREDHWRSCELTPGGCSVVIIVTVVALYAVSTMIAGPILLAESMQGVWKSECILVRCETPRQGVYYAVDFNMTETINGIPCETNLLGKSFTCFAGPGKGITLFHRKGLALALGLLVPSTIVLVFFASWGAYLLLQLCLTDVRKVDDRLDPPKLSKSDASKPKKSDPIAKHASSTDYQSLDDSSSSD